MIPATPRTAKVAIVLAPAVCWLGGCVSMAPTESVESIERARFVAMTRQDIPALRRVLADDVWYCHSNAKCEDKAQFLETIQSGRIRYKDIRVEKLTVRPVGETQLIHGTVSLEGEQAGQAVSMRLIYTDVYVNREGRWQLTAWQSTRVQ